MKLSIVHNSIDYTLKMDALTNPVKSVDLVLGEIYIGYHKPIKNLYVEMTARGLTDSMVLHYYNGTAYAAVPGLEDKTYGLTQSGPVAWKLPTDQEKSTVAGSEKYWLKLTTATPAAVSVNGINLVLSNDSDFVFIPGLSGYLPDSMTSWVGFHEEARNQVVQYIRNSGKVVRQWNGDGSLNTLIRIKQVDQFDLLNIEEFKNAAKYYALHLIFDFISKSDDDNYAQKSKRYHEKYLENLNSNLMSVDENDNGEEDEGENATVQFIRIARE